MKKLYVFAALIFVLTILLSSCSYKQNEWFSDEKLSKCLVPDFPEPLENYVRQGDNIYLNFSEEEFQKYLNGVYEYLKSKDFEYLGARGEFCNSLSGAFASYYFKEADELSEFYVDGAYRFVYSGQGNIDQYGAPIFCILRISHLESIETLEINNGRNSFKYNTVIRLRYSSEEPLSGTYVLRDNEHEHIYGEWQSDEVNHWRDYICTWDTYDEDTLAEHFDYDNDDFCDICGYDMSEPIQEHEHSEELYYDEISHWRIFTCGCSSGASIEYHCDNDRDGKCDECLFEMGEHHPVRYTGFSEGHSITSLCGCCDAPDVIDPHVDNDGDLLCDLCDYPMASPYSLDELLNMSDFIDIGEISSVKLDMYNGLIGRATMSNVSITTDKQYINSIIDFINNARFSEGEGYDGVGINTVTLFANGESFEFRITSRNEVYVNNICYTSSVEFPFTGRFDESYEYINPWKDVYLLTYGAASSLADFELSEIHLRGIEVDIYTCDFTKDADLLVDGEKIRIISDKIIYWKGLGWYEVISEKDFAGLIPDGETTSELVFVTDDNGEIGRVRVSNNVTYTTDELMDMVYVFTYASSLEILNGDGTTFVDRAFMENETIILKLKPYC